MLLFTAALTASFPKLADFTKDTFVRYSCLITAFIRGADFNRPDPIVQDPYAAALGGEFAATLMKAFNADTNNDGSVHSCIRHRMMDEVIEHDLDPSVKQLVLLGAGMDSRSYRLARLADCHVFELDGSQEMMDYKSAVMNKMNATLISKAHDVIVTDIAQYDWPTLLLARGFDPKIPTVWIAEGFLYYVPLEGLDRLFATVDRMSAPNSVFLADLIGKGTTKTDFQMSKNKEVIVSYNCTEKEEEEGGQLRSLTWSKEFLMHRNAAMEYSGTRWDPVKYARLLACQDVLNLGTLGVVMARK